MSNQAKRIALIVQAIETTEAELAAVKTDFKNRLTVLHNELGTVKTEILTGQKSLLPDDPPEAA